MIENKKLQAKIAIERFKKRRRVSSWLFAIGIALLVIHASVMGVEFRFEFDTAKEIFFRGLALLGVAILAAGSAFHFTNQNCPVCKRSFREHPNYEDGLPVFNSLDVCPFCLTPIDADYGTTTS